MRHLLKLEFLKAYRQKSLVLGALLFSALLLGAALTQHAQIKELRTEVHEQQDTFAEKRAKALQSLHAVEAGTASYPSLWDDPRGYFTWHEFLVQMPVTDNAVWAVGQRDLFEDSQLLGIYKPPSVASKAIANPLPMLWGQFDPAFVIVFLMPLILIGLGFQLVGEETSRGTLPLVLSQPISSRRFFLMKAAVWFLPFLLVTLLVIALIQAMSGGLASLFSLNFLILASSVSLYALFWLGVTLLLCRFAVNASLAALGSVMLWVILVAVLPKAVATLSTQVKPLPSRPLLTGALREATREAQAEADKVLAQYYQDHPELGERADMTVEAAHQRFFDYYQKSLSVNLEAETTVKPLYEHFYAQRTAQQTFERNMSFFLPPVMMQSILEILAGNSSQHRLDFAKQVNAFSTQWRTYFQRLAFEKRLLASQDIAQLPNFQFERQAETSIAMTLCIVMLFLNLALLVAFWLSFGKLRLK